MTNPGVQIAMLCPSWGKESCSPEPEGLKQYSPGQSEAPPWVPMP